MRACGRVRPRACRPAGGRPRQPVPPGSPPARARGHFGLVLSGPGLAFRPALDPTRIFAGSPPRAARVTTFWGCTHMDRPDGRERTAPGALDSDRDARFAGAARPPSSARSPSTTPTAGPGASTASPPMSRPPSPASAPTGVRRRRGWSGSTLGPGYTPFHADRNRHPRRPLGPSAAPDPAGPGEEERAALAAVPAPAAPLEGPRSRCA